MLCTHLQRRGGKCCCREREGTTPVKKKILIVDDERDIVDLITYNLRKEGYDVACAYDGNEGLERSQPAPDLIILDLMMPVLDGFETCKRLRVNPVTAHVPIIFLTASSREVDEVVGLELGADDYIQKPISPRKLLARVKAIMRRREPAMTNAPVPLIVRVNRLEINRENYTVHLGKKEIALPKKEFELLALLAANPGKVFTREMLLNRIWGTDVCVIDRTVDVHIRKIREKLGKDAEAIETVKGVGYRYRE
jgi:two-component system, OmpR family, alkaline phosphatase synthesis response regulator PhoP